MSLHPGRPARPQGAGWSRALPLLLVALACSRRSEPGPEPPARPAPAAVADAGAPPEQGPGPRVTVDAPRVLERADANLLHAFGRVRAGESVAHVFTFVWQGDQPLVPGTPSPDCACITGLLLSGAGGDGPAPHPSGQPIPPGAPFAVRVRLDAPAIEGSLKKRVLLPCDSPPGALRLVVTAEVVP